MIRWKAQAWLIILAAVCMAGGIVVPFLPEERRTDVLASGLFLGGLAMLIVALTLDDGDDDGGDDE